MRRRKPPPKPELEHESPQDAEGISEALAELAELDSDDEEEGALVNEERGELRERLRECIAREVPRSRVVRCGGCEEQIDRVSETCPFCRSHEKESLFAFTDAGNAERLAFQHGATLRYCAALGGWLVYDGKRWAQDATGEVERRALRAIRSAYGDVEHVTEAAEVFPHVRRSESQRGVLACVRLAQSHEDLVARAEDFDRDPMLLNVQNGVIDLRTRELREHDSRDLLTKIAGAPYERDARSDLWERVLLEALGQDTEVVSFVRRVFGYCLTGSTCEEKLFVVHGPAGSSKSTVIESFKRAMGDYAMTASFDSFLTKQAGGASNDIARLAGARLVTANEVEKGKRFAEALVKSLTGGDEIAARFLFREYFTFRPQFKLLPVCNELPAARDDDSGLWRRMERVPFDHVVPENERDPSVKATLCDPAQSGAAILAWALEGCLEWQKRGLDPPGCIKDATEDYRLSQDPLADFIKDECTVCATAEISRANLRDAYEGWAREAGVRPIGPREMAERLRAREVGERKSNGERMWLGIELRIDATHWNGGRNASGHQGSLGHQDPDPSSSHARVGGEPESDAPKCPAAPGARRRLDA